MQHDDLAGRGARVVSRQTRWRCTRTTGHESRSGCTPRSVIDSRQCERLRDRRLRRDGTRCRSRRPAAAAAARSSSARIGARLCGWCSGASGMYFSSAATHGGVDAHRLRVFEPAVHDAMTDADEPVPRQPLAQERDEVLERAFVAELDAFAPRFLVDDGARARPSRRSAATCTGPRPARARRAQASRAASANSENLRLDEPAFRTAMASAMASGDRLVGRFAPRLRDQRRNRRTRRGASSPNRRGSSG